MLIDSKTIRQLMINRQLGINELALMSKVNSSTISQITRADKNITFKTAGKLVKALNVDIGSIIKKNEGE